MVGQALALSLLFAFTLPATAQLPPSGTLPESDWPTFRAEITRVEGSLISAPDKATVTYIVARTWASAKQWPETMEWLRKVVEMKVGLDPSRDSVFAPLHGTREFDEVAASVSRATTPISHSSAAFSVPEGNLVPESIAYDPKGKHFYLGSMKKGKVIRCSDKGSCTQFANGLGIVLGLKTHDGQLWLLSNTDRESALIRYDLATARPLRKYIVSGSGHNFNDLVVAPTGDVYFTDTRAGAVWRLQKGAADLSRLPARFNFANGIALAPDSSLLYVSTFPDGISVMDLKTNVVSPIARPSDLCMAMIDGLYFRRGELIAIQNGFMAPRVVRLRLSRDLRAIKRFEVLERSNPLFDGVTTGVVVGDTFFYMANIQDDKSSGFDPITVLRLRL